MNLAVLGAGMRLKGRLVLGTWECCYEIEGWYEVDNFEVDGFDELGMRLMF